MIPLARIQLILVWLYAFPPDGLATRRKKIAYFLFAASVIVALFFAVTSSGLFIFNNFSINLEETIFAFSHAIACSNMLYQSTAIVILRHKLTTIFKSLAKIYEESKNKLFYFYSLHRFDFSMITISNDFEFS